MLGRIVGIAFLAVAVPQTLSATPDDAMASQPFADSAGQGSDVPVPPGVTVGSIGRVHADATGRHASSVMGASTVMDASTVMGVSVTVVAAPAHAPAKHGTP